MWIENVYGNLINLNRCTFVGIFDPDEEYTDHTVRPMSGAMIMAPLFEGSSDECIEARNQVKSMIASATDVVVQKVGEDKEGDDGG